jgi:hypothetical protein
MSGKLTAEKLLGYVHDDNERLFAFVFTTATTDIPYLLVQYIHVSIHPILWFVFLQIECD